MCIRDRVTIVDRKEGAEELFKENGIELRSLVTVGDLDDGSVH